MGTGGDSAAVAASSVSLGDYPRRRNLAVARKANASGHRIAIVALPANDALAVLDAETNALISTVPLGVLPVGAVIAQDGSSAYITILGGPKPATGERAAAQWCCDPHAERVRVDARGIAENGSVSRVDLGVGEEL